MRLRLTLVIPSLERGGAERVMCSLANAWADQGHEVTLITLNREGVSAFPLHASVKRRQLGLASDPANFAVIISRHFTRIRRMRRAFREVKPDLALSFTVHANILTLLAGRGLRVPIAVSERADPGLYKIGPVWELLRRLTYRWAEVLICQTHSSLNWFRKHYGVNGCVIPNPASVPAGADGGALIRGSNQGNTVVAMGRLSFEKGFDLLLSAFAQIAGRHPEWSLKIIGDGPLRSQLLAQCRELKLSGRVDFPGGLSEPFPLLRSADLFVLPSRFEGFPNALCEAMAVGLPAISFDCPSGPAEIIRDGIDGMLVPPQDIEGLASALDLLMGNRALRTQLGMRAREVTARFSLQKVLRMWEDVFRTVRDQRKVGRDTLREEGDLRHDSQRSINQQVLGRRYRE